MICPFKRKTRIVTGIETHIKYRIYDEEEDIYEPYEEKPPTFVYGKAYYTCDLKTGNITYSFPDTFGEKFDECVGEDVCPIMKR